jgi:hypothetical protein
MTRLSKPKHWADMTDENAEGATMVLMHAAAALRNFSGETPFVDPRTGRTVNPRPMHPYLYREIARAHTELGEILIRHILGMRPFTSDGANAEPAKGDDQ